MLKFHRTDSRERKAMGLFFALVVFNIFMQLEIAERIFDSLFEAPTEIAMADEVCGLTAQITNGGSSETCWATASSSAATTSAGGKSKNVFYTVVFPVEPAFVYISVFDLTQKFFVLPYLREHSGVSPPKA